jgi:hypothetical protein
MSYQSIALRLVCIASIALLTPGSLRAGALYQSAQAYPSGGLTTISVAVADVNGDGKLDLVVADQCISSNNCHGGVGILLGNGDGTFQTAKTFDSGLVFASSVAVADVNRDGRPDVVVSTGASCPPNACVILISVLLGNGDGTLRAPQTYTSGGYEARKVVVEDVNGDGNPDLLVANQCADLNCDSGGAVGVRLGSGDGTFLAAKTYSSGGRTLDSIAVGDVNGDGKLDLVVVHEAGLVGVLLGNGDGTFQAAQTYGSGGALSYSIAVADVNGDGKPDLLVTNQSVESGSPKSAVGVLLGNGDGTFQAAQIYSTGAPFAVSIAVADVNGDGKPDLLVAHKCLGFCNSSPVVALLGNGDGTFKSALTYGSGGRNASSIAVADVNGDSKPDLLVANACVNFSDCSTGSVGVLLGLSGVRTTTNLSSSLNPSVYGQAVTLTATVTSVGSSTPTGTVRFQNGTTGLGMATLSGGVAALTKINLPAGILSITATYNGDTESAKSTSKPLSQTVKQASTTTTIASSLNPSAQGQPVTYTAKVTSPTARVTGTVTFTAGSATLGTVTLSGGKASITTSTLPKGTTKITATYNGTANIFGSSASLSQTVN